MAMNFKMAVSKALFGFSLCALSVASASVTAAQAQQVVLQLGPTTEYSTINCANFVKTADGPWKALGPEMFGLGFVQHIVPPKGPIKSGSYIYNNIDLYSQLDSQCSGAPLVRARY